MVRAEQENGFLTYRRRCEGQEYERILASETGEVIVNPVEPVNLPKEITNFLQVEFSPMMIEPGASRTIYLKFPVEIGVFIEGAKDIRVLDVFGTRPQKYTLYGPPTTGVIARWHRSEAYPEIPDVEPFREGVMELSIQNTSREWAEVSYVVFDSADMKIYYGDFVAAKTTMKILASKLAGTNFIDTPLVPGMTRSIELYTARKIPAISRGYLMEWGF